MLPPHGDFALWGWGSLEGMGMVDVSVGVRSISL